MSELGPYLPRVTLRYLQALPTVTPQRYLPVEQGITLATSDLVLLLILLEGITYIRSILRYKPGLHPASHRMIDRQ